jgi:hypothetical protein
MNAAGRGADARGGEDRRAAWRRKQVARTAPQSRLPARICWTVASVALLVALALLVIPPLFVRHAAVVQIVIDDHEQGVLAPVPFAREDTAAFSAALAGRLTPALGEPARSPVVFDDLETAAALRDPLRERMSRLPVRQRDTLVAVVRGQALVANGPADDPAAHLVAGDVTMSRAVPAELVPCRDLFAACVAAPAGTTLVALDMGDLRWDPRLGVVAGLLPAQLDRETRDPLAATGKGDGEECWILGSHDTQEFSGASLPARRSFFSRALELGLTGAADDPQWREAGGDGDGIVELDELVRFTVACTSGWARRESNEEFDQRPVLWRMGFGRVPLDEIPRGIFVIRAAARSVRPPPAAQIQAPAADPAAAATVTSATAAPAAAADPPAKPVAVAEPGSSPQTTGQTAAVKPTLWELLARAASGSPAPIDFAPHLWRETTSLAAAAVSSPRDESAAARRAEDLQRRLEIGLERYLAGGDPGRGAVDDPLDRLENARRSAAGAGLKAGWAGCPVEVRDALAARNRAVELARSVVGWLGVSAGTSRNALMPRSLEALLDRVRAVHDEISRATARSADDPAGWTAVATKARELDVAAAGVRREIDAIIDGLLATANRAGAPPPPHEILWLAATDLPDARQRRRLDEIVLVRKAQVTKDSQADRPAAEASTVTRLVPENVPLRVPPDPRPLPRDTWSAIADRSNLAWRWLGCCGDVGSRGDGSAGDFDRAIAEVRRLATDADVDRGAVAAATRLGGILAAAQARIPGDVDAVLRSAATRGRFIASADVRRSGPGAADPLATIDALLRQSDPRDAARIRGDAGGWVPPIKAAPQLRLVVTAADKRLEIGGPRRATISLASSAAFPAGSTLTLEYDAGRLRVQGVGGDVIEPGRPIRVESLAARDRLLVDVTARRQAGATDADRSVPLRATLAAGPRSERGELAFELPSVERLMVAVRGPAETVEGGERLPDGWRRVTLDAVAAGGAGEGRDVTRAAATGGATIRLRPFPGQVTDWEVAVTNQTGKPRRVAVDLVSLQPVAHDPAVPAAQAVDEAWAGFMVTVGRRQPLPPYARVVASAAAVELADSDRRVDLFLPVPKPAGPAAPGAGKPAAAGDPETGSEGVGSGSIGPLLAVVIRDLIAGEQPVAATPGERPAAAVGLPAAEARTWVLRLPLAPQHPRRYVEATATWLQQDRSVTIQLQPRDGDVKVLPIAGARVRGAALAEGQPLAMRKLEGLVSAVQPEETLRAQWNGIADGEARLAVEIDGHPRARVFRVNCGPAAGGLEQLPQEDWRQIEFTAPAEDFAAYRAPAAAIPLTVAFDGPPDAFGAAGGVVEVAVREVRNLAAGLPAAARVVWAADADRQVRYAVEQAAPPAALAVRTAVSDWDVPLANLGFQDVDLVVEARLKLPGTSRPFVKSRTIVLDGSRPRVTVPPRLRVEKGKPGTLIVTPDDGAPANVVVGGRRAGASGVERIEWGLDAKLNNAPEKWEPVPLGADGTARAEVPTEALALGTHRVVVRAFDRVGLESGPAVCEVDVVPAPPPPPPPAAGTEPTPDRRNALVGRVTFNGRPVAGARVTIRGPSGPDSATSGPDGSFTVSDLDPGSYELSIPRGNIPGKNRLGEAKPQTAAVSPPPAKPASVELLLE